MKDKIDIKELMEEVGDKGVLGEVFWKNIMQYHEALKRLDDEGRKYYGKN